MMQRTVANIAARTQKSEREARELLAQANPGGRIATAEEVALEVLELIEGAQTGAAIVIPREVGG
jgi:uroporphyrinogen-III synthase